MTMPRITHSVTHTHTCTGDTSKAARWPSHLVVLSEGSPPSWSWPISNTATPVRMKSAEFPSQMLSLSLSFCFSCCDACLLSSNPVDGLLCFPEKFKTPGRPQGLLHFKGTNKLFLPQSGFIRQFSV